MTRRAGSVGPRRGRPLVGTVPAARRRSAEPEGRARPPAPGRSFIGRAKELEALPGLLSRSRLMTLTGSPGIGKTRLAVELVRWGEDRYPDGVAWISLARIADPDLVPAAVAQGLGVWPGPGQGLIEQLIAHVGKRRQLLVLDNCEHVRASCALVADALIGACPNVTVLATSQVPLGVEGERTYVVPGLSVPGEQSGVGEIAAAEASRLFGERAVTAHRGFALTEQVAPAVAEICRRLDGIPLAIELAAARVAVISPLEIAERLGDRFALLTGGSDVLLDRHQTLRGAIDWSYDLLSTLEQVLLRRLSVFVGGFALDGALAMGEDLGTPGQVTRLVGCLVDRSLVARDPGADPRYRLLETMRAYGIEQSRAAGEFADDRARHARWYLDLAERAEPLLTGRDQLTWLDALSSEHDNLLAALAWAEETGEPATALRLAAALIIFWRVRGHYREGRGWLESALAMAGDQPSLLRARALWGAGFLAHMLGDDEAARTALEESLALARAGGEERLQARSLLVLGNLLMHSEPEVAQLRFDESARIATAVEDWWCVAHAKALSSWPRSTLADLNAVLSVVEDGLWIARRSGDHQSLTVGLYLLASARFRQGDMRSAEALAGSGLAAARRLGDPYAVSAVLALLGNMALYGYDVDLADARFEEGLAICGSSPEIESSAHLLGRAVAACQRGDLAIARAHIDEAARTDPGQIWIEHTSLWLGRLALAEGDITGACDQFEIALGHARASKSYQAVACALDGLGHVARSRGDLTRAASLFDEGLAVRLRAVDEAAAAESFEALAVLATDLRRWSQGARLLGAAEAIRHKIGYRSSFMPWPEREVGLMTDALGAAQFWALSDEGRALSIDQAAAYARRARGPYLRPKLGWASLTRSEREVIESASLGLTNAGIGERLSISRRTVDCHLHNAFKKLEIRSRRELASVAPAGGWTSSGNLGI